jgi:hypothetical protein
MSGFESPAYRKSHFYAKSQRVMSKRKPAPPRSVPIWNIYRLNSSSPAAFVGVVQAADAKSAVKTGIELYAVPLRRQQRLFAVHAA